jgi:hypothetical protein
VRNALDVAHCALYMLDVKSLAEQLHDAMSKKGWSVPHLLRESRLACDRSSLQRKLTGEQKLSTEEAQRLAETLECVLAWVPEDRAS